MYRSAMLSRRNVKGSTAWCWSDAANEAVIALVLSEVHSGLSACFDVLVEGRSVVKYAGDLYDTKEECERAHWARRNWSARVSQAEVAKSLFPVQPLPDGAIPYYLGKKEKSDEEV